ncbi:monovalent cation:proton antiporter family protein [Desulfobacca acetoxidans]|uniref:Sodium/hydrogen exchanger n=1 Tax=Desulfobacca acetoxidans (strain ATCC 700848 / DSM 11109 / ASRB2) TaxID=880072 RepID=F2NJW0_DESAR|nr:monovalent cation:proton antiporter family protein [Desulfobacca acetoxidans]AEB09904.1 sodium/hydrogen exchanger [Desulfobacca acetoxidans DSM 11109]
MHIPILTDLVVIFGLSLVVLFVCHKFQVPVTVGFIFTGILAGPHVLALVRAIHEVEILAEIGVILLLFTIGVEFSFANLLQIRQSVLVAGPIQVVATCLAGIVLAWQFGRSWGEAIFIGFLLSLSSTAIVLKLLQERAEVDTPHGRTSLGVLIFQDIVIVPMMLFVPLLAGASENIGVSFLVLLLKGLVIVSLVIVSAKYVVPQALYQIARTGNRELFLISIVLICAAVAWVTAQAGLSLALGAFLAGLIVSETEYSHQALGNILPFRDVFASFFFISIGMLLDVNFLLNHQVVIVLLTLGVLLSKAVLAGAAALALKFPLRTSILVGLALCQVGEFSFILSKVGVIKGLFSGDDYQLFLDVTILTMVLTPLVMALAPRTADFILRWPLPQRLKIGSHLTEEIGRSIPTDHLIIVGYGVNGRNLARAAKTGGIPYVIVEMNPETVRREQEGGQPIFYGDATQEEILIHARIKEARIIVVVINDPAATRRIVTLAHRLNPQVYIIVRTRYLQELQPLFELGASDVVPEEFETSVEIFTLVLKKYLVDRNEIERFVTEVRANGYLVLRGISKEVDSFREVGFGLRDFEISTFRLHDGAPLVGKSLAAIELRKKYGVTVLAIRRGVWMLPNPDPDMQLLSNDLLIVMGTPDDICKSVPLFTDRECSLNIVRK